MSDLRDTTIENQTILVSDQGDDACTALGPNLELRGCTIILRISDDSNDFGNWPEFFSPDGGLVRADFSAASLNGSRLVNVDTEDVTFPPWPCFTILNPTKNAAAFAGIDWPYDWSDFAEAYTDEVPETTAVTALASYWVRKGGGTEADLRAIVEPLDFVR